MSGSLSEDQSKEGQLRVPGVVNAHSHAFHRLLRGRTHHDRGSFWTWRNLMYGTARQLTPELYQELATAVFAEMLGAGYTAVGEFHYVHHQPDGTPYSGHAMEHALAQAALDVGIRLVLLDTCYLDGGFDPNEPGGRIAPNQTQQRFTDRTGEQWLQRHLDLKASFAQRYATSELISLGTALHSVRAVPRADLEFLGPRIPEEEPLHIHLSEQPQENADTLAATGLTPTGLLAERGLLSERLSAVHATHLTEADVRLLGQARAGVVMCPTTEADLADGIGPAKKLQDAGAVISLGSDQHAVVDPWVEARSLEYGERLNTGERGRFSPRELAEIMHDGGSRSLRIPSGQDWVTLDAESARTAGSVPSQIQFSATAADVLTVEVAGRVLIQRGEHASLGSISQLMSRALRKFSH